MDGRLDAVPLISTEVPKVTSANVAGSTRQQLVTARFLRISIWLNGPLTSLGFGEAHPTLCPRCADVVQEMGVGPSGS